VPWLERVAHDPDCPINFDPELNEYNLIYGHHTMRIYHCPFCAGRAPESLRDQLFATVPEEETARLHRLTMDLKTEEEVLAKLGEPTQVFEMGGGMQDAERDGVPGDIHTYRAIAYDNYSEFANIRVTVGRYGKVRISFFRKYLGRPSAN
jgi:hypothetical protein